jgi:hypothetical protein
MWMTGPSRRDFLISAATVAGGLAAATASLAASQGPGAPTNDLLNLALSAYGGLERWRSIDSITVKRYASGALWDLSGLTNALRNTEMRIELAEPKVTFFPFTRPGIRGVFKPDVVWIETEDEKVLEKRENPKASFVPLSREKPWDHLHALYFSGYAGLNYQSEPFMFTWPGFEVNEIEPWEEDGQRWRRLRVLFPDHIPTHCKEQVYYINEKGLIQRHDYIPESVKLQAPAAQYLWDHKAFSGITLATRRRVVRREQDGKSAMSGPTLVWLEIIDAAVSFKS